MPATVDVTVPVRRLTPGRGQYFFGYYDLPAAHADGVRHLCHEVAFRDHFPRPDDPARLGILRLTADQPAFEPFAETLAWNFQQGSMLQWLAGGETVLYNVFQDGEYGACLHDLRSGGRRVVPMPVANVASDGTKAVCINLSRVYGFRPGYGYEELPDPNAAVPAPEDDGVWLEDLATGECRFILSYRQIVDLLNAEGAGLEGAKVVVNHITFNPSANRFLFLLRNFPEPGRPWLTFLLTSDLDGRDVRNHPCYGMASHYHWRNDRELLFWMNTAPDGQAALVLVDDETGSVTAVDPGFFKADGHCSHSPDGEWILYDTYPDGSSEDYLRGLQVYSPARGKGYTLGRFRSERLIREIVDLRCDLHPRWMPDGRTVTFDSIHEGYRGVYLAELDGIIG